MGRGWYIFGYELVLVFLAMAVVPWFCLPPLASLFLAIVGVNGVVLVLSSLSEQGWWS